MFITVIYVRRENLCSLKEEKSRVRQVEIISFEIFAVKVFKIRTFPFFRIVILVICFLKTKNGYVGTASS